MISLMPLNTNPWADVLAEEAVPHARASSLEGLLKWMKTEAFYALMQIYRNTF